MTSSRCNAPTKTTGAPCRRPVAGGGTCGLHPDGSSATPGPEPFTFSEEQIHQVEELAAVMKQEAIASFFGISDRTLRRKFLEDPRVHEAYARGRARIAAELGTDLIRDARGLNEKLSEKERCRAREFYLRTQAGWSEKSALEVTGENGGPIDVTTLVAALPLSEIERLEDLDDEEFRVELERLAERRRKVAA